MHEKKINFPSRLATGYMRCALCCVIPHDIDRLNFFFCCAFGYANNFERKQNRFDERVGMRRFTFMLTQLLFDDSSCSQFQAPLSIAHSTHRRCKRRRRKKEKKKPYANLFRYFSFPIQNKSTVLFLHSRIFPFSFRFRRQTTFFVSYVVVR